MIPFDADVPGTGNDGCGRRYRLLMKQLLQASRLLTDIALSLALTATLARNCDCRTHVVLRIKQDARDKLFGGSHCNNTWHRGLV